MAFGGSGFGQSRPLFGTGTAPGGGVFSFGGAVQASQPALFGGGGGGFGAAAPTPSAPLFGSGGGGTAGLFGANPAGGGGPFAVAGAASSAFGGAAFGAGPSAGGALTPQVAATPGGAVFGGFAATASGFGQSQSLFGASPSPFGANANTAPSPGGLFGAASTPSLGAGSGIFGASPQSQPLFGGGIGQANSVGGIFGSSPGTPAFPSATPGFPNHSGAIGAGPTQGLFAAQGGLGMNTPTSGTAAVKFQPTTEPNNASEKYMNISRMKQFQHKVTEELRVEDYQAGNKGAKPLGILTTNPSGASFNPNASTGTSPFSQNPPQASAFSPFGPPANPTLVGSNNFPPAGPFAPSSNAFVQTSSTPFSLTAPVQTGFSTFNQSHSSSLFNSTPTLTPNTGASTSAFSLQPKPGNPAQTSSFTFPQVDSTKSLFTPVSTFNVASGPSLFPSISPNSSSPFGVPAMSTPGVATTPGLFSSSQGMFKPPVTQNFMFATNAASTPSLSIPSNPYATGNSLFTSQPSFSWAAPAPLQTVQAGMTSNPFGNQALFMNAQPQPLNSSGLSLTSNILGASSSPALSSSPLYRRTARPITRVRARGLGRSHIGSGSNTSSLFEATSPAASFSPDQFLGRSAVENKESVGQPRPDSSVKTLRIEPESETRTPNTRTTPISDAEELTPRPQPIVEEPLQGVMRAPTSNQSLDNELVGMERRETREPDGSTPIKPTPLRMPGQYIAGFSPMPAPSSPPGAEFGVATTPAKAYSTYKEFFHENIRPRANGSAVSESQSPGGRRPRSSNKPTLTRDGYYTRPPMAVLRAMTPTDLASISNFVVGRATIGEVMWLGETDITGLDLDSLVILEPREIIVYPNDDLKPPEGEELNKPAVVTLEGIWKMSSIDGQPLKSGSSVSKYVRKLQQHCERENTQFLGYEATTGTWRFEVPHFSRYGLKAEEDNSSDDEEESEAAPPSQSPARSRGRFMAPQPWDDNDESQRGIPLTEHETLTQEKHRTPSSFRHFDFQRLYDVKEAIFESGLESDRQGKPVSAGEAPDPDLRAAAPAGDTETRRVRPRPLLSRVPFQGIPTVSPFGRRFGAIGMHQRNRPPSKDMKLVHELGLLVCAPETSIGLACGQPKNVRDMGEKTNCFRVGFGTGNVLASVARPSRMNRSYRVLLQSISCSQDRSLFEPTMRTHLTAWSSQIGTINAEMRETAPIPNLSSAFSADGRTLNRVLDWYIHESEVALERHQEIVYRLLNALYRRLDSDLDNSYIPLSTIRARLSAWLKDFACDWSQKDPSHGRGGLEEVFALLSEGNVENATRALLNLGESRLASLVARAMEFPKDQLRNDCELQLETYVSAGGTFSTWEMRKNILLLLSGQVNEISKVHELSWYRMFGLHFWYGTGANSTDGSDDFEIVAAVRGYDESWRLANDGKTDVLIPAPFAPHSIDKDHSDHLDMAFLLLCLYTDVVERHTLVRALSPQSTGVIFDPLDYRLAWHVYQLLQGNAEAGVGIPRPGRLHENFACQLEAKGMFLWSIYVLSCLPTSTRRDQVLQDAIIRLWPNLILDSVYLYKDESDSDDMQDEESLVAMNVEDFLGGLLKFPLSWLRQASIIWHRAIGDGVSETIATVEYMRCIGIEKESDMLKDDCLSASQFLILKEIFPRFAFHRCSSGSTDHTWAKFARALKYFLEELDGQNKPAVWNQRGQVLLDILGLILKGNDGITIQWANDLAKRVSGLWAQCVESPVWDDGARVLPPHTRNVTGSLLGYGITVAASYTAMLQREMVIALSTKHHDNPEFIREASLVATGDLERLPLSRSLQMQLAADYYGDFRYGYAKNRRWMLPEAQIL